MRAKFSSTPSLSLLPPIRVKIEQRANVKLGNGKVCFDGFCLRTSHQSLSLSHTHTHSPSLSFFSLSHSHTQTHTLPLSLFLLAFHAGNVFLNLSSYSSHSVLTNLFSLLSLSLSLSLSLYHSLFSFSVLTEIFHIVFSFEVFSFSPLIPSQFIFDFGLKLLVKVNNNTVIFIW